MAQRYSLNNSRLRTTEVKSRSVLIGIVRRPTDSTLWKGTIMRRNWVVRVGKKTGSRTHPHWTTPRTPLSSIPATQGKRRVTRGRRGGGIPAEASLSGRSGGLSEKVVRIWALAHPSTGHWPLLSAEPRGSGGRDPPGKITGWALSREMRSGEIRQWIMKAISPTGCPV